MFAQYLLLTHGSVMLMTIWPWTRELTKAPFQVETYRVSRP